jgi:hypothetical protein
MFDASRSASYHTTMRLLNKGHLRTISTHRKRWGTQWTLCAHDLPGCKRKRPGIDNKRLTFET